MVFGASPLLVLMSTHKPCIKFSLPCPIVEKVPGAQKRSNKLWFFSLKQQRRHEYSFLRLQIYSITVFILAQRFLSVLVHPNGYKIFILYSSLLLNPRFFFFFYEHICEYIPTTWRNIFSYQLIKMWDHYILFIQKS